MKTKWIKVLAGALLLLGFALDPKSESPAATLTGVLVILIVTAAVIPFFFLCEQASFLFLRWFALGFRMRLRTHVVGHKFWKFAVLFFGSIGVGVLIRALVTPEHIFVPAFALLAVSIGLRTGIAVAERMNTWLVAMRGW